MRLILLPANPGQANGYEIAVRADLLRLGDISRDLVFCYADQRPVNSLLQHLPRMKSDKLRHISNVLRHRPAAEVWAFELRRVLGARFCELREIFCGEVVFYRALRRLFPAAHLQVRFHNFFSFARYRQKLRRTPLSFRMAYHLHTMSQLESCVLRDKNVTPIFITEEELQFARLAFPQLRAECWPVIEQQFFRPRNPDPPARPWLIHFGSASAVHTAIGLRFLCQTIFPEIAARVDGVELHLFGTGSKAFENSSCGIFGHGRYEGPGLPHERDGLFVVPDLHGCGIKLKVADLLRANVPFIATPFGIAGYRLPEASHILIGEIEEWPAMIHHFFRTGGVKAS